MCLCGDRDMCVIVRMYICSVFVATCHRDANLNFQAADTPILPYTHPTAPAVALAGAVIDGRRRRRSRRRGAG